MKIISGLTSPTNLQKKIKPHRCGKEHANKRKTHQEGVARNTPRRRCGKIHRPIKGGRRKPP